MNVLKSEQRPQNQDYIKNIFSYVDLAGSLTRFSLFIISLIVYLFLLILLYLFCLFYIYCNKILFLFLYNFWLFFFVFSFYMIFYAFFAIFKMISGNFGPSVVFFCSLFGRFTNTNWRLKKMMYC